MRLVHVRRHFANPGHPYLGLSRFAYVLDMNPLPYTYLFYLAGLMVVYLILAQIMKNIYIKRFKKWI